MRRTRVLSILLAAGLVNPCWAADYRELNGEGIGALRAGEFAKAEALFKQALTEYQPAPDKYDNTIKSNLAVLYRKMGRADDAAAMEAQVAAAEGRSGASGGAAPVSERDYINFARQHVNSIVGAKLQHPCSVTLSSANVMKRPGGDMAVSFAGSTGDRHVSIEIVVSRNMTGQFAIASSQCEAFYGGGSAEFESDRRRRNGDRDPEPDSSILSQPAFGVNGPTAMTAPIPDFSALGGALGGGHVDGTDYAPPAAPPTSGG